MKTDIQIKWAIRARRELAKEFQKKNCAYELNGETVKPEHLVIVQMKNDRVFLCPIFNGDVEIKRYIDFDKTLITFVDGTKWMLPTKEELDHETKFFGDFDHLCRVFNLKNKDICRIIEKIF